MLGYKKTFDVFGGQSWRFITDMDNNFAETANPSGISDNYFFSNLYNSELNSYFDKKYKILK